MRLRRACASCTRKHIWRKDTKKKSNMQIFVGKSAKKYTEKCYLTQKNAL